MQDLGNGYKYKNRRIEYPNGDVYQGMAASYYDNGFEPHGEGTYFQKSSGVLFKAIWVHREGPDFKTVEIIEKPEGRSFVLVQAYAGEIYSDLVHLDIIEAKEGEYPFEKLPCIVLDPHAWAKHLFVIKSVTENELTFDFKGPKVDHGNFIDKVIKKGEPQTFKHTISSTIIWEHDDEYESSQTAEIKVLYF